QGSCLAPSTASERHRRIDRSLRRDLRPNPGSRRRGRAFGRVGVSALTLRDLHLCFEGAVPAVIATASSTGVPNVTFLSRVRVVDDERIALSNQFFSKTQRNLAENPRASVLVVDPLAYLEFRLTLVYERTERRGVTFDKLKHDVEAVAAVS